MKKSTLSWPVHNELIKWYSSPLGQRLQKLEQQQLDQCLIRVFGYYGISLGALASLNMNQCAILNKLEVAAEINLASRVCLAVDFYSLPFAEQSIDLFILPHLLEFSHAPEEILAEVSRCLIGNGHVLILGFNPRSLFGLWHWLQGRSGKFPWRGKFYPLSQLRHWLKQTDFVIDACHSFYFRPPFNHSEALKKMKFLEVLGPLLWPQSGACYAVLAHKQVGCMTSVKSFKKIDQPIKDLVAAH